MNETGKNNAAGDALKEYIREAELTQAAFADKIGVSPQLINLVIKGNRKVTSDLALRLGTNTDRGVDYWLELADGERNGSHVGISLAEQKSEIAQMIDHWLLLGSRTLVDHEIRRAVKCGFLRVSPFEEKSLQPTSYDARFGEMGILHKNGKREKTELAKGDGYELKSGEVLTVRTLEKFQCPNRIEGNLAPMGSLCQEGLFFSNGLILDCTYKGELYLTLKNESVSPIRIRTGQPFLTISFKFLSVVPEKNYVNENNESGQSNFKVDARDRA